jgi:hypothetical protein
MTVLVRRPRELVPDLIGAVGRVHQKRGAIPRMPEQIHLLEVAEQMAGDEVGFLNVVRRLDLLRAKAQVGDRL